MSEVKTQKQEAIELLTEIESMADLRRDVQATAKRERLHDLTMKQANLPRSSIMLFITHSVDICLTLPLPDGYFWLMESKFGRDPYGATLYKAFMKQETQTKYQSDASLPLAMLQAWWSLQDE